MRRCCLGLAVVLLGCGGSAGLDDDGGPSGPAAQAAFVAAWTGMNAVGKSCAVTEAHTGRVGDATADELRSLVTNGKAGASVSCAVVMRTDGFQIHGKIERQGTALEVDVVLAGAEWSTNPAVGTATYSTVQTAGLPYSDSACRFYFSGNVQEVAAGRAWFQLECDNMTHADIDSACVLGVSTVAMQNCQQ